MLSPVAGFRSQLSESGTAFKAVFANRNLRFLELSALGSNVGAWAYSTAVAVYAYETNGAKAVAFVWVIRSIPSAIASPLLGVIGDRYPRKYVMIASDLGRVILIMVAAGMIWQGVAPLAIYLLTGVITLVGMAFYPAQASILPSLAESPNELTAANVTSSTIGSVGFFAGPALAGALLAVTDPQTVFLFTAALTAGSALSVSLIRPPAPREKLVSAEPLAEDVAEQAERWRDSVVVGFRTVWHDRRVLILVILYATGSFILGAMEVFVVPIAIEYLGLGQSAIGYLNAAFGVGALIGAIIVAGFVGVRRLSIPFVVGAVLIGAPIAFIAISPSAALTVVCLGILGLGNTLLDVAGDTLLQRAAPEAVLARVWGVLQMTMVTGFGVGAAIAPALLAGVGIRTSLVILGLVVPLLVLAFGPSLIRMDAAATAPAADRLAILGRTPIFAPLPGSMLERLAFQLIPVSVPAGEVVIREGDAGDRFYLISSGSVAVTTASAHVATLGPGDYVGEIALLRDVPRTATVTSTAPTELFALKREDFLTAVGSHEESREAAETAAMSRLEGLQGAVGRLSLPRV